MARLNQILAIEKGAKTRALERITEVYQKLQKPALLNGLSRTYQPLDEMGEKFPPEQQTLQLRVPECLAEVAASQTEVYDIIATKDVANRSAASDVLIDGKVFLKDMPVTTLLSLEKELLGLHTVVKKLPVLDSAQVWHKDPNADAYATDPVQTVKTKKIPKNHVKADATDKFPAQVEMFTEDVVVGYWTKIEFSGAISAEQRNAMLRRVESLQDAVKVAREAANQFEVTNVKIGKTIFDYLFAP